MIIQSLIQTPFNQENSLHLLHDFLISLLAVFRSEEAEVGCLPPVLPTRQAVQRLGRLLRCLEELCDRQ